MAAGQPLHARRVIVTGRRLNITGPYRDAKRQATPSTCGSEVVIRHCTLVPGWGSTATASRSGRRSPASNCSNLRARVRIEHSIVGSIEIHEDEVRIDPIPMRISDSIVDATQRAAGSDRRARLRRRARGARDRAQHGVRHRGRARDRARREQHLHRLRERGAPAARLHALLLRAAGVPHAAALPLPARPGGDRGRETASQTRRSAPR